MIRRQRKQTEVGIDLTPCIDMTFILLIFFMVSTTFVKDMKIDIDPLSGEEVAALVRQVAATPPDTVARVRAAMGVQ